MISSQKKIWSQEQDELLKRLFEQEGMRNWSMIAKRMTGQLQTSRKSAKQCRQRYENHINLDTAKVDWTLQEEMMLIQYHNEIGNKWALIAQKIPGKSDNSVKNHFYSKLRKVLRKLNAIIHSYLRRQFREININIIYKIVEATQQLFKEKPNCQESTSQACREVQNKMLHLSMLKEQQFDSEERIDIYREVVKEVYAVSKLYKRKSKKSRNHAIQAPVNKSKRKRQTILLNNQPMDGYLSDQEEGDGEEESPLSQPEEQPQINNHVPLAVPIAKTKEGVIVKEEAEGIKDLLKDAGLLQFQKSHNNAHHKEEHGLKFSSKSSFKSYSQKNDSDHQFFQDSDLQRGFISNRRRNNCFQNIQDLSQRSDAEGQGGFYYNC